MKSALALSLLLATIGAAPPATLTIGGAFVHSETLNLETLAKLPHIAIPAVGHDGTTSQYRGVKLSSLLHSAGLPNGPTKGAGARSYVAIEGADGYVAIYALIELNVGAKGCAPIVADRRNGAELPADIGPLRVVAPCDRVQSRWVRNVVSVTIVTVPETKH